MPTMEYGTCAKVHDLEVEEVYADIMMGTEEERELNSDIIGDTEAAQSITVTGTEFEIIAKEQLDAEATATVLIIGNETGGRVLLNITVLKYQLSTS